MSANVKHLVPLSQEPEAEPAWVGELKEILCRLVDIGAGLVSSRETRLVLREILTVQELAERFKMPESTVEEMARTGKLPAFKVGKHWRFDLDLLKKELDKGGL